jgi:hypothetical protein
MAVCLPLLDPKILQSAPAFRDNQVALGPTKGISAGAAQMRLISLGVAYPIEDVPREHLVAESGSVRADLVHNGGGKEDWACQNKARGSRRMQLIRLVIRCRLTSSWNWFLRTGIGWKKPVLALDGSIV